MGAPAITKPQTYYIRFGQNQSNGSGLNDRWQGIMLKHWSKKEHQQLADGKADRSLRPHELVMYAT